MSFLLKLLGYVLTAAAPILTGWLAPKIGLPEAATIGGAVGGVGGRILHQAPPPAAVFPPAPR